MTINSPVKFAVLGDSAASGVGDSDQNQNYFGWCYHLAQAFNEPLNFLNVSRPGAQSKEVLEIQLPKIFLMNPDLVAVIVGGNDLLRNGFSPKELEKNLNQTLAAIEAMGGISMMLELHDPTEIVPMPKLLKRVCRRRVNEVNRITRKMAMRYGSIYLETRSLPDIYNLQKWHVDRMHPSHLGHRFIADSFGHLLRKRGFDVGEVKVPNFNNRNAKDSFIWMIKNGTPWFIKRSFDLLPAVMILMTIEAISLIKPSKNGEIGKMLYPVFAESNQNQIDAEGIARVS